MRRSEMKVILQKDILDDDDYIIRQKGDEIEVQKHGMYYRWEYCPGIVYDLIEDELEVQNE
jgi:hypothetical protein